MTPHRFLLALATLALASSACAISGSDTGVYAVQLEHDSGSGASTNPAPITGSEGMDAATTCVVQGNASVTGAFASGAFDAKDAIEIFDATKAKFTFLITDYASACATGIRGGSSVVSIAYDGTELGSAAYDVTKTAGLTVTYSRYDASCRASAPESATSGSVTFTRLDECGGLGSFDLVVGGAHVTSNFTASVCSAPSGADACH